MELLLDDLEKYTIDYGHGYSMDLKTKGKTQANMEEDQHEYIQKNVIAFYCQYLTKLIINI